MEVFRATGRETPNARLRPGSGTKMPSAARYAINDTVCIRAKTDTEHVFHNPTRSGGTPARGAFLLQVWFAIDLLHAVLVIVRVLVVIISMPFSAMTRVYALSLVICARLGYSVPRGAQSHLPVRHFFSSWELASGDWVLLPEPAIKTLGVYATPHSACGREIRVPHHYAWAAAEEHLKHTRTTLFLFFPQNLIFFSFFSCGSRNSFIHKGHVMPLPLSAFLLWCINYW